MIVRKEDCLLSIHSDEKRVLRYIKMVECNFRPIGKDIQPLFTTKVLRLFLSLLITCIHVGHQCDNANQPVVFHYYVNIDLSTANSASNTFVHHPYSTDGHTEELPKTTDKRVI